MKHIDANIAATRRRLMRRVWYSYFISLVSQGSFVHGFLLGGSVALFGRLTHVAAITDNLLQLPLSSVAVLNAEEIGLNRFCIVVGRVRYFV